MNHFNSSALHAGQFDPATGTLTLWFTSSAQGYDYYDVPIEVWEGLKTASSAGTYFNLYIRDQYAA